MNSLELRSWLFVPADSERKIVKALSCGADAIILDLEDAVALALKPAARARAVEVISSQRAGAPQIWVRINPRGTPLATDDLAAILPAGPHGLVLPKCESGADVAWLANQLNTYSSPPRILSVATETAQSLFGLGTYAGVSPLFAGLTWGAEDLSSALGAASKWEADGKLAFTYQLARSLCLAGAVAANVQPVDTVWTDFRDAAGLQYEAETACHDGFTGKLAIHPDQVPIINTAFSPSAADVAHAEAVIALFAANPSAGTLALNGTMLDRPHLIQAERLLARAKR